MGTGNGTVAPRSRSPPAFTHPAAVPACAWGQPGVGCHHFTWLKLAALIANVLIVIYLVRIALQSRAEMKQAG
ncbi:MAG: hypothetical protein WDW38_011461 [Sanguina aurantia]